MGAIDQFTAGKSLLLGAALSGANPKNLALTLAAAASIAQAGLDGGGTTVAIAVFVIIGSITVAGPVLFFVFAPDKASGAAGLDQAVPRRAQRGDHDDRPARARRQGARARHRWTHGLTRTRAGARDPRSAAIRRAVRRRTTG